MANKVFTLDNTAMGNNQDLFLKNDFSSTSPEINHPKLWLFMIGGSAAGVITPLSRFFISMVSKDVVIPIFIDYKCHSQTTSDAISDIAQHEEFCKLICTKSIISQPFFFIEDSIQTLKALTRFKSILNLIKDEDEIFIAFSAHSDYGVSVATEISRVSRERLPQIALKYGIFLPYQTFCTNADTADVLNAIKNDERRTKLNRNLGFINNELDNTSTKFVVGLTEPSIIKESEYQRNPFNIVQLIMSFAIASLPNLENGWFEYSIQAIGDCVKPGDVISDENFRRLLVEYDFTYLAFRFLLNQGALPIELCNGEAVTDSVVSYLKNSTYDILSLGDMTTHRSNRMLLRKSKNLNYMLLNNAFSHKTIFGKKSYTVNMLSGELTNHIRHNMIFNPNMAVHETIASIKKFIVERFETISKLYY